MNLYLKTLEFWSDKNDGWQSGPLLFGQNFTFVSGENTCGKTPLLRGIFFALGVPSNFRNDILENCAGVRLEVELAGAPYLFQRTFADKEKVLVKALRDGAEVSLTAEKEVSKYILGKLGYPEVKVTTNKATESSIYFSTIAPLFWKEQLSSWDTIYHTENRFIDDQREEAMRFLLGLQPRNPFGVKAEIKREKKNIEKLNEEISDRNEIVRELQEIFGVLEDIDISKLEADRDNVKSRLIAIQSDFSALSSVSKEFDSAIQGKQQDIGLLTSSVADRTARIRSLRHMVSEVSTEAETLSLNDDAADRFRNFESICSNAGCGMFLASKEAYGKSLLYLKDQMKDLETNIGHLEGESAKANAKIESLRSEVQDLQSKKSAALHQSGAEKIAAAVQLITGQLIELETKIAMSARMGKQKARLEALLSKRGKTHDKVDDLEDSKKSRKEEAVKQARINLAAKVNVWKESLHLTGLKGAGSFDTGFKFMFGSEKYQQLDGSARVRAVLAFHAALLELALEVNGNHPKIFILDTPKQQELKTNDLKDYFNRLRTLTQKYPDVQIVFSSSEFNFTQTPKDRIWSPNYPGEKHPMYLGISGSELSKEKTNT